MGSREQAANIINTIASQAQAVWGDRWIAELVRRYCEIESIESGKGIKPVQRRSQLVRALEEKTCELTTLMRLLQATGIEIELYVKQKL
ncbi:MAG: hypothetical protein HC769_33025 [Cyanobacteria bacterium CRU_2_1]|nr:hypothetical protein [Cyanobacteria bacterium CRU_2_1]